MSPSTRGGGGGVVNLVFSVSVCGGGGRGQHKILPKFPKIAMKSRK